MPKFKVIIYEDNIEGETWEGDDIFVHIGDKHTWAYVGSDMLQHMNFAASIYKRYLSFIEALSSDNLSFDEMKTVVERFVGASINDEP